jgi:hypothetical protein
VRINTVEINGCIAALFSLFFIIVEWFCSSTSSKSWNWCHVLSGYKLGGKGYRSNIRRCSRADRNFLYCLYDNFLILRSDTRE